MIKNDPQRMAIRKSARALIIIALFMIAISIVVFVLPSSSGPHSFFPVFYIVSIIFIVALFVLISVLARKVDKRRALALQGDQSMLAAEQPVSNANALPLPINIELRPATRYYPFFFGVIIVGGIIGGLVVSFSTRNSTSTGHHASLTALIIVIAISLAVLILLMAIFYFVLRRQMRYLIQVDEQGIVVAYNRITTRVNWNEARLFTVNAVKKARRPKIYELASEDTIVRWMWIPQDINPFFILHPTIPQQEYDRQMQGLLEMVAGRTHLPLYDISQLKTSWYM